jgi:hypothetical protein
MLAIPGDSTQTIISCNYDPTGLAAVDLFDNPVMGWLIDETQSARSAVAVPPIVEMPIITGTMPPAAEATGAILSPQWAHVVADSVYVPDAWRGRLSDFFTWIATNNGAQRKVRGNFRNSSLNYALATWAASNPALFNAEPF